jgi:hypothetical protein
MKLPSIAATISFKLSALYLMLFVCSFLSIGLSVYWMTYHSLEQQLKNNIETEAIRLKTEYDSGDLSELKDEIDEVAGRVSHSLLEYGIIDQNSKLIAGNFNDFKLSEGWQLVTRMSAANKLVIAKKELFYVRVMALPNGVWLAVG